MAWHPRFRLYASDGTTLVYEFLYVQNVTNWLTENPSNIEITNLRSQGSINIAGGQKSIDLTLQGILISDSYENLTSLIFSLETTVLSNTNYILKLDKSPTTHDDIRVIRVEGIKWEDSLRLNNIKYSVTFKTLSW
jgi:hypothetical protein